MMRNSLIGSFLALLCAPWTASANEALLTITATGYRYPPPFWADEGGRPIRGITLDFRGAATTDRPYQDVKSNTKQVRLVDALTYPASIILKQPKTCFIGTNRVGDNHVGIIHQGRPYYESAGRISINSPLEMQAIAMVFKGDGGYGRYTGVVSCGADGSLTYTYL